MFNPNNPGESSFSRGLGGRVMTGQANLLDRVLGWLGLSLLVTAGGVYTYLTTGFLLPWFIALIAMIGLIFAIQASVRSRNPAMATPLFILFAYIEGLFIGPVIEIYLRIAPDAVGNAVLGTAGVFVLAAGVVWLSHRSFAAWGKWLLIALVVGIVLSIASIFLPISQLFVSGLLGLVFVGLTIFDFWRVKAARPGDDNALLIAMSLYLDFVNIFLILLRIFGGGSRR